jgi:hypothetical protein
VTVTEVLGDNNLQDGDGTSPKNVDVDRRVMEVHGTREVACVHTTDLLSLYPNFKDYSTI